MKKALLAALCFIIVGLVMVNGTFALPSLNEVFQLVENLGEKAFPEAGGMVVDVNLISDEKPQNLFPGSAVSRAFQVKNQGTGDVYFRLVYAVQYDAESWPKLDIRFTTGNGFTEHEWKDITIDSTPYKMKVFTYTEALGSGITSPKVTISIAMDTSVTSEQISRYRSDFLQTQVLAIETTSFNSKGYTTAVDALNAALPLNKLSPF